MNLGKVDILARVGKNGTNDPVIPVELGIGHLHSFVQYDLARAVWDKLPKGCASSGASMLSRRIL